MRQMAALALMILLALSAAGCALSGGENTADEIMLFYSQVNGMTAVADVSLSGETASADFRLRYEGTADDAEITVLQPEELADMQIHIAGGETALSGDIQLYTGRITALPVSPVTALSTALSRWQSGYMSGSSREEVRGVRCVRIRQNVDENTVLYTWFDCESYLPLSLELVYNDRVAVSAVMEEITLDKAAPQDGGQQ